MDGRHHDPLSDVVDREIASLLAVDPSPEFLARVRTRVAEEPAPGRVRLSWMLATAGAMAVAIVAAIAWPSREAAPSMAVLAPSARVAEAVQTVTPPGLSVESPRPPQPIAIAATPVRDAHVEVAAEDARAFDALLVKLRERDVVLVFDDVGESALAASMLAIAPIAIDPLPMIAEGGVE